MTEIHSCSYYCDRPECIKAQRDELRDRLAQPEQEPVAWEDVLGAIARGWTHDDNRHKTMDVQLAVAIAKEIQDMVIAPPQPEQEPVAYYHPHKGFYWAKPTRISAPTAVDVKPLPLYTAPPQPEQQRMAKRIEELEAQLRIGTSNSDVNPYAILQNARIIEARPEQEKVASWMQAQGYATGHGDTIEGLLKELEWQVRESEREACAKVCDHMEEKAEGTECCKWPTPIDCASAIRARGQT